MPRSSISILSSSIFREREMHKHLPYDRSARVADTIYQIVADALRTKLTDPRLVGTHVTRVSMTKDLRIARVCFHMEGANDEIKRNALKGFVSSRGFLKRMIGEAIELKFMPELQFFYDEGVDTGDRIGELLSSLAKGS